VKVIYITCFTDPWLKVARELKEKHDYEPVYWIGWHHDNSDRLVPNVFPNAIYHPHFNAWKGLFPDVVSKQYAHSYIDIDFIRKHSGEELQAIKMMDRMDPDCHSFSFAERQRHYRNFLKNWTSCIELLKPDLIISSVIPHRVYDYVLYLLCRHFNIPYLTFQHTAFSGRIIPLHDIFNPSNLIKHDYDIILAGNPDCNAVKETLAYDILERYQNVQKDYNSGAPEYMKASELEHKRSSNGATLLFKFITDLIQHPEKYFGRKRYLLGFPTYFKQHNKGLEVSYLNLVQYSFNKIKTNKLKRKLENYYNSRIKQIDLKESYIYFPLQYQPEMTSNPSGDIFVDQFLCVEKLVQNIPNSWYIYIKEHPVQFHSHGEGQTSRIREFYDDLLKIPNVRLLHSNLNSFDLISNSQAVATISGTAGWEAMVRHKPVLVFGLSWYEYYPGVLKVCNEETAGTIYNFIRNFSFAENKLLAYLAALQRNSMRAYHQEGLKEIMDLSEKECVQNLISCIIKGIDH
jgi:hypothetical protein